MSLSTINASLPNSLKQAMTYSQVMDQAQRALVSSAKNGAIDQFTETEQYKTAKVTAEAVSVIAAPIFTSVQRTTLKTSMYFQSAFVRHTLESGGVLDIGNKTSIPLKEYDKKTKTWKTQYFRREDLQKQFLVNNKDRYEAGVGPAANRNKAYKALKQYSENKFGVKYKYMTEGQKTKLAVSKQVRAYKSHLIHSYRNGNTGILETHVFKSELNAKKRGLPRISSRDQKLFFINSEIKIFQEKATKLERLRKKPGAFARGTTFTLRRISREMRSTDAGRGITVTRQAIRSARTTFRAIRRLSIPVASAYYMILRQPAKLAGKSIVYGTRVAAARTGSKALSKAAGAVTAISEKAPALDKKLQGVPFSEYRRKRDRKERIRNFTFHAKMKVRQITRTALCKVPGIAKVYKAKDSAVKKIADTLNPFTRTAGFIGSIFKAAKKGILAVGASALSVILFLMIGEFLAVTAASVVSSVPSTMASVFGWDEASADTDYLGDLAYYTAQLDYEHEDFCDEINSYWLYGEHCSTTVVFLPDENGNQRMYENYRDLIAMTCVRFGNDINEDNANEAFQYLEALYKASHRAYYVDSSYEATDGKKNYTVTNRTIYVEIASGERLMTSQFASASSPADVTFYYGGGTGTGWVSIKHESSGNPGCIADHTGKPYSKHSYEYAFGLYQLTYAGPPNAFDAPKKFVNWCNSNNYKKIYKALGSGKLNSGSSEFMNKWKALGDQNNELYNDFVKAQIEYAIASYMKPALSSIKQICPDMTISYAIEEMAMARSIHMGTGGFDRVLHAMKGKYTPGDEQSFIETFYQTMWQINPSTNTSNVHGEYNDIMNECVGKQRPGTDDGGVMSGGTADTDEDKENNGGEVVKTAEKCIGRISYQLGADNISSYSGIGDCSSFTQYVFRLHGVTIGRTTEAQYTNSNVTISRNQGALQPGDLIFFKNTYSSGYKDGVSHVAIYAGNGQMIHNSSSGGVVKSNFSGSSYYSQEHFLAIGRVKGVNSNELMGAGDGFGGDPDWAGWNDDAKEMYKVLYADPEQWDDIYDDFPFNEIPPNRVGDTIVYVNNGEILYSTNRSNVDYFTKRR